MTSPPRPARPGCCSSAWDESATPETYASRRVGLIAIPPEPPGIGSTCCTFVVCEVDDADVVLAASRRHRPVEATVGCHRAPGREVADPHELHRRFEGVEAAVRGDAGDRADDARRDP